MDKPVFKSYMETIPHPCYSTIKRIMHVQEILENPQLLTTNHKYENNKRVILLAVCKEGHSLQYASETLKNNKGVVISAVTNRGCALRHASTRLQNDLEVILYALYSDLRACEFIGKHVYDQSYDILRNIITELHSKQLERFMNSDITEESVKYMQEVNFAVQKYVEFDEESFIMALIQRNPIYYKYASYQTRSIKSVALFAISRWTTPAWRDEHLYAHIPKELTANRAIAYNAMLQDGCGIPYFPDFYDDDEVVFAAIKNHEAAYRFASARLKKDEDFSKRLLIELDEEIMRQFY